MEGLKAELSTRDNVARAIYTEVKEGRGTPHGGAFLDISYQPAERVKRKPLTNSLSPKPPPRRARPTRMDGSWRARAEPRKR